MADRIKVLAVDDEETMLRILKRTLENEGFSVETCADSTQALARFQRGGIELIITDLMMGQLDGFALLEQALKIDKDVIVIVITAFSSVESAVKAMKLGAYDFIPKPFDPEHLLLIVQRALENKRLRQENIDLKKELSGQDELHKIIGASKAINEVKHLIDKVKATDSTVLITGESGTGKELVARAIHTGSSRVMKNFVPINCGALPDDLLESELFGYEKGAFTGAAGRKIGLLQLADGGTLFLDEAETISPMMQVKLLRFLQDRSFMRLGGNDLVQVDVRILAATNENLLDAVKAGTFRRDLYYRLHVITIEVPPLRQRREDIPLLCRYLLAKQSARTAKSIRGLSQDVLDFLQRQPWEGNVRELENCIESTVTFCEGEMIEMQDLPAEMVVSAGASRQSRPANNALEMSLADLEALHIKRVLDSVKGNKSQASKILGIDYTTMLRKLKKEQSLIDNNT